MSNQFSDMEETVDILHVLLQRLEESRRGLV
jgi:hypothetical protein